MKFDLKSCLIGSLVSICFVLVLGQASSSTRYGEPGYQMKIREADSKTNVVYVLNQKTGKLWRYLDDWGNQDFAWKGKWTPANQVPESVMGATPEK
jgi:hypothetical protein